MSDVKAGPEKRAEGAQERTRAPARSRLNPKTTLLLERIGFAVLILVIWELASGRLLDPFWISKPSEVASTLLRWVREGILYRHATVTFYEAALGFAFGGAAGITAGFILGLNRRFADVVRPFIVGIYSIPKLALAPLFLLWFGIGVSMKAALAAVLVFFLVFFNTYSSVVDTDQWLVNLMRLMGGSRSQIIRKVVVRSALPGIFLGIRIALPYALVGAVVGELISSNSGLGFLVMRSAAQFDTAGTFAGVVVIGAAAVALSAILEIIEARLLKWKTAGTIRIQM